MSLPLRLRVFLASPGDVSDERALARQVLERLPYDPFVRNRFEIEIVAWDGERQACDLRIEVLDALLVRRR
jgi:hypothetical protein